jgi:16S rRNA (adenine(1408)-N(1))-methyltransferase
VVIDIGTGDGRAVSARAIAEPPTLAIGLDANAAAMAEVSRRAARPAGKGGLPNALFAVASAETPPHELAGIAELVTVTLPWGSLLGGMLGRSETVACGVASLLAPGGTVEALVSTASRDCGDLPCLTGSLGTGIAAAWAPTGLDLETFRPATDAELASTPSSWARRLRLGATGDAERAAWRMVWRRPR